MIAVSMMFRYADLITLLNGSEYELGWIVGIGMCGDMARRMVQGTGIDRYGSGNIWIASVLLVCVSLCGDLGFDLLDSPLL